METTKQERAELLAVSPLGSFRAALCRDVDTLVAALEKIAEAPLEKGSSFRVLNQIRAEVRELLREPQE